MVMVLPLISWHTDGRTYGQSCDNQSFPDRWVTKISKKWGSAMMRITHSLHAYWSWIPFNVIIELNILVQTLTIVIPKYCSTILFLIMTFPHLLI